MKIYWYDYEVVNPPSIRVYIRKQDAIKYAEENNVSLINVYKHRDDLFYFTGALRKTLKGWKYIEN